MYRHDDERKNFMKYWNTIHEKELVEKSTVVEQVFNFFVVSYFLNIAHFGGQLNLSNRGLIISYLVVDYLVGI